MGYIRDDVTVYIKGLENEFITGIAREHSYRPVLKELVESFNNNITAVNDPKQVKCGAPDFIIQDKDGIQTGYIETKDIDKDLDTKTFKEQFDRYINTFDNLIITNYLNFRYYTKGFCIWETKIAELRNGEIIPLSGNHDYFNKIMNDFTAYVNQSITNASDLAKRLADRAIVLSYTIKRALDYDDKAGVNSSLRGQLRAFKKILIHDITSKSFADIYAQTIAYGLFAARLNDPGRYSFTRYQAARLIPKTNPFLKDFFKYIASYYLDERIEWIVDALANILRCTDIKCLLKSFKTVVGKDDPFIHFYETFLAEYDPSLRKSRGVWYTPEAVVNFIVRSIDDILKADFNISRGLADESKAKIKVELESTKIVKRKDYLKGKGYIVEKEIHEEEVPRVQILDPAAGTGTFLAEIVKHIYNNYFNGQKGMWTSYVDNHLIPRLNGFEILMASYTMAHIKLEMLLRETNYRSKVKGKRDNKDDTIDSRFRIYLNNSLGEYNPNVPDFPFAGWLSDEVREANEIKENYPVMIVLGNPPYSVESQNKGDWLDNLLDGYKKEPGTTQKLKERNSKSINDDYVKFIRYGQYFIEKNKEGILAFINNHSFLDNLTFRGMRYKLLEAFDKIYIIDLHGNARKRESAPNGLNDVNVLDIQQGVSINIFVKTKKSINKLARVYHYDLYGEREFKYDYLLKNDLNTLPYTLLESRAPYYFFVKKDFKLEAIYNKGFYIKGLFKVKSSGVTTGRDQLSIHYDKEELIKTINDFANLQAGEARDKYSLGRDSRDWKVRFAKDDLINSKLNLDNMHRISYRPFDIRWTYYTGKTRGFHSTPAFSLMRHIIKGDNIVLVCSRQCTRDWKYIFITKLIGDRNVTGTAGRLGAGSYFPLYLYPEAKQITLNGKIDREVNFNMSIVKGIAKRLKFRFVNEKENNDTTFAPIDILDYIYAVLHSPSYRDKYEEFLKIDFPRVPYPEDSITFWKLVDLGKRIRELHLLESKEVSEYITSYPEVGSNIVEKLRWECIGESTCADRVCIGRLWINNKQYFGKVPLVAYEFYIGGYQPAQKWLKDRKGRKLSYDDIAHYQKVIVALYNTHKLMAEIDHILYPVI